jgi:hypothetical protein
VVGRNRLLNKVLTSKEPKSVETRGPFSKFEGQFTTPPPFFSFLFFSFLSSFFWKINSQSNGSAVGSAQKVS